MQVGPDVCPPLEIPPGFFDKNMVIKYGYDTRNHDAVNINPYSVDLYTVNSDSGMDYKFIESELPMFWKSYIKQIDRNPELTEAQAAEGYDTYLLDMTRIYINWYHVGQVFNDSNWPPASWLNNHTKKYMFTDE